MQGFNLFIFTFCKTLHECSENAEAECTRGMIAAMVLFFRSECKKKKNGKEKQAYIRLL